MLDSVTGAEPPTGTLYVAGSLQRAGHDVRFLDGAFESSARILAEVDRFRPDVFGVGCVVNLWPQASRLLSQVGRHDPSVTLVAGGPGPSVLGERCLAECPALDVVVMQEGEITTPELVDRLSRRQTLCGVAGALSREEAAGRAHNDLRPAIADLDSLAYPAYDLVDVRRYRPHVGAYRTLPAVPVVTSRGCPFHCLFCSQLLGHTIRYRQPDACMEEIASYARDYAVRQITFYDEHFTFRRERVERFCELFLEKRLRLLWMAAARVDSVDEDILKKMKRAGCSQIFFGIESGVQKNLDFLCKGNTVDMARRAVAMTHAAGILTMSLFILGIPGETVDEAKQTGRFARELNSHYSEFFPLTPFPGTRLAEIAPEFGALDPDIEHYNMHSIVFVPATMTREELESVRRWAYLRCCLNLRFVARRLRHLRYREDFEIAYLGLKFLIRLIVDDFHRRISRKRADGAERLS
jgi:radical SAM superfamily enzyme YgiQ (UPF0313 family)